MNNYQANIEHQIRAVQDELRRSKDFVNVNGYDCTTALFMIVQSYRLELKRHLNNLMVNLQDLTEDQRHLPKWACTKLGWHVHPTTITSTYGQLSGRCPRCDKHVLMDSQGDWF